MPQPVTLEMAAEVVAAFVCCGARLRAAACEPTGLHLQRDTERSSPTSAMGAEQLAQGSRH